MVTRLRMFSLESEEKEESHHETEKSHGLRQSESQNGVGEELLLKGGVAGIADDEGTEDASDTGTGSGDSDGGSSSTNELGSRVNVPGNSRSLDGTDWGSSNQRLLLGGRLSNKSTAHRSQVHLGAGSQL